MNLPPANAAVPPGNKWAWGTDLRNCLGAARDTKDSATLEKMVEDVLSGDILDNGEISEELIQNHQVPFAAALELARLRGDRFAVALCERYDATAEVLKEFSDCFDAINGEIIVSHHNTDPDTRLKVAGIVPPWILSRLIQEGHIKESEFKNYCNHKDWLVRSAVAIITSNPSLLNALAQDEEPSVRAEALMNKGIAIEIVEKLAFADHSPEAKLAAAKRSKNPVLLRRLADSLRTDFNADLADALKQNENAPEGVRVFAALVGPK